MNPCRQRTWAFNPLQWTPSFFKIAYGYKWAPFLCQAWFGSRRQPVPHTTMDHSEEHERRPILNHRPEAFTSANHWLFNETQIHGQYKFCTGVTTADIFKERKHSTDALCKPSQPESNEVSTLCVDEEVNIGRYISLFSSIACEH